MLCVLFGVLWLAGGASRADAPGQLLVRGATWGLLCVGLLFGERPDWRRGGAILFLLLAALALALVQMIPLPPGAWQSLPGHGALAGAATVSGQPQPWRSWSVVPSSTLNAASSLVVPFTVLACMLGLRPVERRWVPGIVLIVMMVSIVVALLQFSGSGFDNPFVNDTPGEVSGTFANRNHFALFLAIGCLVAPVWAFQEGSRSRARGPIALGLVLLFELVILATGSRAGLLLGLLALAIALVMTRRGIARALRRYPRWVFPAVLAGIVGMVAISVLASVAADRAVSIDRMFTADIGQDMRGRALPTVLEIGRSYFPMGYGLGGFDPVFRMHEPFGLLNLTYFNHAHNDLIEVVLDAGLPGLLLLLAALLWWGRASVRAWRSGTSISRLGSATLLLIIAASLFDYPARTPLMMAMIVVAGMWLRDKDASPDPAELYPR